MLLHPDRYSTSGVTLRKMGVVVHDSESGDGSAQSLVAALQRPGDRPIAGTTRKYGSGYHAVTDGNGGYIEVADATAGPFAAPPANKQWWHVCMPGRAAQSRDEWLDDLSRNHIRGVARFIVDKAAIDGFPFDRLNVSNLLAGDRGYCGHVDISNAWHQSDHTDPGPGFPWDVLAADIAALTQPAPHPNPDPPEDDDMKAIIWSCPELGAQFALVQGRMVSMPGEPDASALLAGLEAGGGYAYAPDPISADMVARLHG